MHRRHSARIVALAIAVLAIALRAPHLLTAPRFWAEEGTVYFADALRTPWTAALTRPHFGYLALYANAASVVAAHLPLALAPLATTLFAFAAQLLPIALVLWSRASLFDREWRRLLAGALVLQTPMSGELWLNTINSQFHLAVAAFIILLDAAGPPMRWRDFVIDAVLLIAGLSGAVTCFLAPAFAFKAWNEPSRRSLRQAFLLCFCAALQMSIVLWSAHSEAAVSRRFATFDLATLGAILAVNTVVFPIAGFETARRVAQELITLLNAGDVAYRVVGISMLAAVVGLGIVLLRGHSRRNALLLGGGYALLTVLSIASSTGSRPEKWWLIFPGFGGRYFYAPTVIVGLTLLSAIRRVPNTQGRTLIATRNLLCGVSLLGYVACGVAQTNAIPTSGPAWRSEVEHWQRDRSYAPKIWPQGWTVDLRQG